MEATPSPKKSSVTLDTPAAKVGPSEDVMMHKAVDIPAKAAATGGLEGSALRDTIMAFLRKFADDASGVALQKIQHEMKGASDDAVRKTLECLVDDGEIFTTINDEHF